MPSQVVAFLRRSRRGTDWSQEEIAELYRIEHALLQARFSLETDRGVSDEGDPWFVFCRADGEVLVHITRSEDGYLLYGLGLPRPLTGRVIGDISKSFVNQIPLNIPVRRADGPQLFVHPAAALAIIVGMIFLANDDVSLIASDQAAAASGSEGAESADRTVKASVLAVLGKFADGTLLGGERLEANHQEGTYLNIVCTIAAVMMGAAVALDIRDDDLTQVVAENAAAVDESTHAQQSSPDSSDTDIAMRVDGSVGDQLAAAHAAGAASPVLLQDDAQLPQTTSSSTIVEAAQEITQQAPTADPGAAVLDHEKTTLAGDAAAFDQPTPIIQAEAGHSHAAPAAAAASEPAPEPSKQIASNAPTPSANAHQEAGTASVEEAFQHLLKSVGLSEHAQTEPVLSLASIEILQNIPTPVVPVAEPVESDIKSDAKDVGDAVTVEVAHARLYPLFDLAAREVVTKFLEANPDSQAYYYDHSVIVYDGYKDYGSRPVTVQVWELENGSTIAIVGHADNPAIHA